MIFYWTNKLNKSNDFIFNYFKNTTEINMFYF